MIILNTIREAAGTLTNEQIGTLVMNTSDYTPYELGRLIRVVLASEQAREQYGETPTGDPWFIGTDFYDAFDKFARRSSAALAREYGTSQKILKSCVEAHEHFELIDINGTCYVRLAKGLR